MDTLFLKKTRSILERLQKEDDHAHIVECPSKEKSYLLCMDLAFYYSLQLGKRVVLIAPEHPMTNAWLLQHAGGQLALLSRREITFLNEGGITFVTPGTPRWKCRGVGGDLCIAHCYMDLKFVIIKEVVQPLVAQGRAVLTSISTKWDVTKLASSCLSLTDGSTDG